MSVRSTVFEPTQVQYGGKPHRGYKLRCGNCSAEERKPSNTMKGSSSGPETQVKELRAMQRKFEGEGWFIGATVRQTRCPECIREAATARANKPAAPSLRLVAAAANITRVAPAQVPVALQPTIPEQPTMTQPKAPEPREMSREDRRIIFAKLNEVYVNDKVGYGDEWTDKLVAEDLGIPMAWVALVRDENFGPIGGNEIIAARIAEAKAVVAECNRLLEAGSTLKAQMDQVQAQINALNRELAPLQVQASHIHGIVITLEKTVKP